ncbi:MAG: carboxypeptidase regulatory-like domain-containing protein [Candidatus Cloacimonetes bacterium]|nr:carboxypeptidase regulatory-like domain-containing protein [Candidatus Cloacimonadota bacterium]
MKKLSLILTAMFVLSATVFPLFASEVTIGAGNQQARLPIDTLYKNSLYECLYFPDELNIVSGSINEVAFYNNFVSSDATDLPTKIWLGTTTLTDLTDDWIPSSSLTLVYDGNVSYPAGQNTIRISFSTPFDYSGGTLVMMMLRPPDTRAYDYSNFFYTQTIGTTRARIVFGDGSNPFDPAAPPTGTATIGRFPKTTFFFTGVSTIQNDLTCLSITGDVNPGADSPSEYSVRIKNNGQVTQDNYAVRLMQEGGIVLGNLVGNPIMDAEEQTYIFSWIPTTIGPANIYGRTVLTGDEVPANNQSAALPINVQAAGTQSYTFGLGDQQARLPINMYYKASLFETIYLADELDIDGIITGIQIYNNFVTNLPNKQTNIWMGETTHSDLTQGWIPSTELTHVFSGGVNYPAGENNIFIPFSTPLVYGGGNLVLMMERPLDNQYYDSLNFFKCQTVGSSRSLMVSSRSAAFNPASPPADTSPSNQFPKATFLYINQLISHDLSCTNMLGNSELRTETEYDFVATIRNNGLETQSDYLIKLMKEGDVELGSIAGNPIAFSEVQTYTFQYTPSTVGTSYLYCKVVLIGDEVPDNDKCTDFPIIVWEAGTETVTIGMGNFQDKMPINLYAKNSLFECLYFQNELNITSGNINGLVFYNNFPYDALGPKHTKIWLGNTTRTDLTDGWIPSTELTLVYDGDLEYPLGSNNIEVAFDLPFIYYGATLVMMVQRPWDATWGYDIYWNAETFYCQALGNVRSLREASWDTIYDPAAPPTTTVVSGLFPKTTFYLREAGTGSLNGTVCTNGTPLEGATVSVANTNLSTVTDAAGHYSFPYILHGTQVVTAALHGYTIASNSVTITEGETYTSDFALVPLAQITVSGRIVGSDDLAAGISGASIVLSGYESYTASSGLDGYFFITGVFGNQSYQYAVHAVGYQLSSGPIQVNAVDLNMGDIIVNEIANAPRNVVATESITFTQVDLIWDAAAAVQNITESFEGDLFPPNFWTQIITNTGTANAAGILPTWCSFGTVPITPAIVPHDGARQAGLRWTATHQDEWLKTPAFVCPSAASLTFWSHVFQGSLNGDHYYVKVSTDNGATWSILWDASTLSGGWNSYSSPITIDLSLYAGRQITIAWNARDSSSNNGLWYDWFIDDITIEGPGGIMTFPASNFIAQSAVGKNVAATSYPSISHSLSRSGKDMLPEPFLSVDTSNREMLGYKVWRFLAVNQSTPASWTLLTPEPVTSENYADTAWEPLPAGIYKYAVRAVFSNNVQSHAAFSNEIPKGMSGTLAGTVTESGTNLPISGVKVTAGRYFGLSDADGAYSFNVFEGIYTITATKPSYRPSFADEVIISTSETIVQHFVLEEMNLPAAAVQAVVEDSTVNIDWMAPGTSGGEWIHYDSGIRTNSVGTGGAANFDVAIRFPPSALARYAGMSLYSLNVWPTQAGNFSVKVWTGGDASAPANLVVNQPFTPNLVSYTMVNLENPVPITGTEELWFGYNCNVSTGLPAGCDAGPQVEGFSNMICYNGNWSTIAEINDAITYNWNIQGFVGYSTPDRAEKLYPLDAKLLKVARDEPRALFGYKVWRLPQDQVENEAAWTNLTPEPILETSFQDSGWSELQEGIYKWAVKAVYAEGLMSDAAFSNAQTKVDPIGTISGMVRNSDNEGLAGATITAGSFSTVTNHEGAYSMSVIAGDYRVAVYAVGYETAVQEGVIVADAGTTTLNFTLEASEWVFADSFETYADFDLAFEPWILVDVDQGVTQALANTSWPNSGSPQAFIIFNPAATIPPASDIMAHEGTKFAACLAASTPPNDDWMISPKISVLSGSILRFWARSLSDQNGLERFNVGVSTDESAPDNFNYINGTTYLEAATNWSEYTFDLSAYADRQIRFGIQCVSDDASMLMVDDLRIIAPEANSDALNAPLSTTLRGNYPNPFNPETIIHYSVKEKSPVNISIYNLKGQLVNTLVNEERIAGKHSVRWNGRDSNGHYVSSGVYLYRMSAGNYTSSKKMILMK